MADQEIDFTINFDANVAGMERAIRRFAQNIGTIRMPMDEMRNLILGGFKVADYSRMVNAGRLSAVMAETGMGASGLGGLGYNLGRLNLPTFDRAIAEFTDKMTRQVAIQEATLAAHQAARAPTVDAASAMFGNLPETTREAALTMSDLTGEMNTANESKSRLRRNLKKADDTVKGFSERIVSMGGKLRSVSRLFFYASLDMQQFANVVLGPMRQGLVVFEEYNKTMTRMRVNFEFMGESGQESLDMLETRFKDLSDTTEFSRLEFAKAAAVFGTAGIAADDVSESLDDMARLARVNFTTMDQVATITLRTMRRFRLTMEEATTEMWRLSAISQMTGESIFEVANQMGYASELGQELSLSFQEITTHMYLLTEVYGSASIAGRRLSALYGNLISKGEEYGIQLRDMNGEMLQSRDMIANLADYMDLIADPIAQNQYLMELFGTSGASTAKTLLEAFKTGRLDEALAETGDNMIDKMQDLSDAIKDELYVSLQDLRSEIQNLQLAIGEALVPAITAAIGPITNIIQNFTIWVDNNREVITTLGAIAVGMTALATVIKGAGFLIEIVVALAHAVLFLANAAQILGGAFTVVGLLIAPTLSGAAALVLGLAVVAGIVLFVSGAVMGFIKTMVDLAEEVEGVRIIISIFQKYLTYVWKLLVLISRVIGFVALLVFSLGAFIGHLTAKWIGLLAALEPVAAILGFIEEALTALIGVVDEAIGWVEGLVDVLGPGSPTLAERFWELGDAIRATLSPMQNATMWGRRLNDSMRGVGSEVAVSYGRATAAALQGGLGVQGGTTLINVDGAYVPDPVELAEIIAERQIQLSKRHYRRTAY